MYIHIYEWLYYKLLLYYAPGSKESLGEATNYFTTLNWSNQWRQERSDMTISH